MFRNNLTRLEIKVIFSLVLKGTVRTEMITI